MNRKITIIAAIAFALFGISACTPTEVAIYTDRVVGVDVRPVDSSLTDPGGVEGAPCEGAQCPTPPPVTYPCTSGEAEGAITEGAGSVICP